MERFEYQVWSFAEVHGSGRVTYVNGVNMGDEAPRLPEALAAAGADGWRLVHTHTVDAGWVTLIFERPAAA